MKKTLLDNLMGRMDQLEKKISILEGVTAPFIENKVIEYSTRLEVSPCLGEMNWEKAIKACKALGEGWKLPTFLELHIMYSQNRIDDTANYWSSTEFNAPDAFVFTFSVGNAYTTNKNIIHSVRGVRAF